MVVAADLSYLTPEAHTNMWRYLARLTDRIPSEIPNYTVTEYAERKRVMPSSSPFPGRWENRRTPYLNEVMDNMSVTSDVRHTVVMKGAQLGFTAAAENVCLYWMDAIPTKIMFMSSTQTLLKKWVTTKLDPAIDSVGMREKIFAQSAQGKNKRSGDTMFQKEFVGGALTLASANAAGDQRGDTNRILIRDEVDGAPAELSTGEGNWIDVSYARVRAYGERAKVMDFSTPTTEELSVINKQYLLGDQRFFQVACPYCGGYQVLDFGSEQSSHGMRGETKAGILHDVYLLCSHCREPIRDHQKQELLNTGYWEPTTRSSVGPHYRSYQINSLYSPQGMFSFWGVWQEYLKSKEDPINGPRFFQTLTLGLPYREMGQKPELENVVVLRNTDYKSKEVPEGVLFLTAGIDVQRGSKGADETRRKKNPPRLELEVCGHGAGFRTWSICHEIFEGEVRDISSGAWGLLTDFVSLGGLKFFRRRDEFPFEVQLTLIDSGDGELTTVVYDFCMPWRNTFPSKGYQWLRKLKGDSAGIGHDDIMDVMNAKKYKSSTVGEQGIKLYTLSTNYYKSHTYRNINTSCERFESGEDHPGRALFPRDYSDEYFAQLTAETKKLDGSFHCGSGIRNEALDCRVMNLAAGDIYLDSMLFKVRAEMKRRGAKPHQIEAIRHKQVLQHLAKETNQKQ